MGRYLALVNLPFEGCSIQGPFITFNILHASLYSRSGSNFGVSKKHLQDIYVSHYLSHQSKQGNKLITLGAKEFTIVIKEI